MSSLLPPLPADGTLLQEVRSSCASVRRAAGIKIRDSECDSFLRNLDQKKFERLKGQHGVSFPLRFPSTISEVNFLSLLALLNTLSGYRIPFHKATGSGAYQNILRLMMGLYLSSPEDNGQVGSGPLGAQGLADLTAPEIAQILSVSLHEEKLHESIPALTVGTRGGDIAEAVDLVVECCNTTGQRLLQGGYPDLGSFVLEVLKEAETVAASQDEDAAIGSFVTKLARAIPGFADMALIDGSEPVYLFKKIFFLLFSLQARLAGREGSPYVPSSSKLPMFVDNVIPTMIAHFAILDFSEATSSTLRSWEGQLRSFDATELGKDAKNVEGPVLSAEEAYTVRAAALDAGVRIVERARQLASTGGEDLQWLARLNEVDLDGYLWSVAKDDPLLRRVPRLVERKTIMC